MTSLLSTLASNPVTGTLLAGVDGQDQELLRQTLNDDKVFWDNLLSFFVLVTTIDGVGYSYTFPLMFSPRAYQISEPYSMEPTNTLGGLVVEESGVVQRRISITAHQGVKPHPLRDVGLSPLAFTKGTPNYLRNQHILQRNSMTLSGQRHFQYLKDNVFRAYSDLKANFNTAAATHLYLHIPQDDEHFEVAPANFGLSRDGASPALYPYTIELLCIGPADAAAVLPPSPTDASVIGTLQSAATVASQALQKINGCLNDLTQVVGNIRLLGQRFAGLLLQASNVATALGNFVDGAASVISLPSNAVLDAIFAIDNVMYQYDDAVTAAQGVGAMPAVVVQRWRELQDAYETILLHPQTFQSSRSANLQRLNAAAQAQAVTQTTLGNTSTLAAYASLGTAATAGDAQIAAGDGQTADVVPLYQSVRSYTLQYGDSLESVALRNLGDAARYRDIVLLNGWAGPVAMVGLGQPPASTDATAAATVLRVGQIILLPSTQPPVRLRGALTVLGAPETQPVDAQVLGTDLALLPVPNTQGSPRYDLALDPQPDGTYDARRIAGTALVAQAAVQTVTQPVGSNPTSPTLGMPLAVGTGLRDVDQAQLAFNVQGALLRDARVGSVAGLSVQADATTGTSAINATLVTVQGSSVAVVA